MGTGRGTGSGGGFSRPLGTSRDLRQTLGVGGPESRSRFFGAGTQRNLEKVAASINAGARGRGMIVLATPRKGTQSGIWKSVSAGIDSGLRKLLKEVVDEPGIALIIEQLAIVLTNELHKRPNVARALAALFILSQLISKKARELTGLTNRDYRIALPDGFLGLRGGALTLSFNEAETGSILPSQLRLEIKLSADALVDVTAGRNGYRVHAQLQDPRALPAHKFGASSTLNLGSKGQYVDFQATAGKRFGTKKEGVSVVGQLSHSAEHGFHGSNLDVDANHAGHRLNAYAVYSKVDGILGAISYNSPLDGPQRILVVVTKDAGNVLRVNGTFAAELAGFGKFDGEFAFGNKGQPFTGVIAYNTFPGKFTGGATARRTATATQLEGRLNYNGQKVQAGLVVDWDSGRDGRPVHIAASAEWQTGTIGNFGIAVAVKELIRVGVKWEHKVGPLNVGVIGTYTSASTTEPAEARVTINVNGEW